MLLTSFRSTGTRQSYHVSLVRLDCYSGKGLWEEINVTVAAIKSFILILDGTCACEVIDKERSIAEDGVSSRNSFYSF
jgi:hypothetical protein